MNKIKAGTKQKIAALFLPLSFLYLLLIAEYPQITIWLGEVLPFLVIGVDMDNGGAITHSSSQWTYVLVLGLTFMFIVWATNSTTKLFRRRKKMKNISLNLGLHFDKGYSLIKSWSNEPDNDIYFNKITGIYKNRKLEVYDSYEDSGLTIRLPGFNRGRSNGKANVYQKNTYIKIDDKEIEHEYIGSGVFMPVKKIIETLENEI